MNEKALEWMAECGEGAGHKIGRITALAAAIVFLVWTFLTAQLIFMIGAAVFGVLYYWMQIHSYIEYEYCYFADDLDIAAIYNKARRKKKLNCSLAEVEYMVKGVEEKEATKYFCNKNNISEIYTLVINQEGKRTAVVMEPSQEFLQVLQMRRKLR